jgi:RNA polymerase-binding transcription factor DksA
MTQNFDEAAARNRLRSDHDRVQGLIEGLRDEGLDQEEADQVGDLSHLPQHPADQGSEVFEREKDMAILEQLEGELAEIEAALQRLDEGTYGVDEVTGDPIAAERLDAYPIARTNVDSANVDSANVDSVNTDSQSS